MGPVNGEGNEDAKLKSATISALKLADKHKLKSIAFPAISTGAFGFPKDRCANIMLNAVLEYANEDTGLKKVVFCLYDNETFKIFSQTLDLMVSSK